jgi:hypothetical protein
MDNEPEDEKVYLFEMVRMYREHIKTIREGHDRTDRAQRHNDTLQMSLYVGLLRNIEAGNIELAKSILQDLIERIKNNFAKDN